MRMIDGSLVRATVEGLRKMDAVLRKHDEVFVMQLPPRVCVVLWPTSRIGNANILGTVVCTRQRSETSKWFH